MATTQENTTESRTGAPYSQSWEDFEDEFAVDVASLLEHIVALENTLWAQECEISDLMNMLRFQCENVQRLSNQNQMLEGLLNGSSPSGMPEPAMMDGEACERTASSGPNSPEQAA